jgi:hypothetical protein
LIRNTDENGLPSPSGIGADAPISDGNRRKSIKMKLEPEKEEVEVVFDVELKEVEADEDGETEEDELEEGGEVVESLLRENGEMWERVRELEWQVRFF